MIEEFLAYKDKHGLFGPNDRILAAVSGGVDSMTMLDLLLQCGVEVAVAHCNFSLRGGESNAEQRAVERTCAERGITCHTIVFDTKAECNATGESTQMAARRLRYAWFDELCAQYGYSKIAIAHHSDDSIETFFINLMRGTGLRGLTGISIARDRIIRPLLFASRSSIERYAINNALTYLTDSSNLTDDYLRGRLRHDILPRFSSSAAAFGQTMTDNIERLNRAQLFIDNAINAIRNEVIHDDKVDLTRLATYGNTNFIAFELLRPYGFSADVVDDILLATHSGKQFYAQRYIATLDRHLLIITSRSAMGVVERTVAETDPCIEWIDPSSLQTLDTETNVALLCADALQFPLRIRRWQAGDWFVPLGMHSQKKVSDYLIDAKVALPDKEQQAVLLSGDTIIWLVGRRIDDRYRLTEGSMRAIRITL